MHELSIALSILDVAEEQAIKQGALHVTAIHLKLGPLSGVVKSALLSAYLTAREATIFAECELLIEEVPVRIYCTACAAERPVESIQNLCCAVCRTPASEILNGRELEIAAMEIS